MPGCSAPSHLTGIHAEILGRLQRQFAESLQQVAQHIEAAEASDVLDTRYHLQQALAAATGLRVTLHEISKYCGALETAMG